MKREKWEPLEDGEDAAPQASGLRRIAVVLGVLLVFAAAFAAWALFIYHPSQGRAATPTSTRPARTATGTVVAAGSRTSVATPAATGAVTATRASTTAPSATSAAAKPTATQGAAPTSGATGVKVSSPSYGMHIFGWWRSEVADRDMGLVADAGFGWVKQLFAWTDIEGAAKGHYNWTQSDRLVEQAAKYGLKLLVRVDTTPEWAKGTSGPMRDVTDFADFMEVMANRYKGKVAAYQIWNEPNLAREWGGSPPDPGAYADMLKAVYARVKQVDPNAIIVSAGLAPTTTYGVQAMPDVDFVKNMYIAGGAPYFDALGAHGAGFLAPPEADPGDVGKDPVLGNPGDLNSPDLKRVYCFRHVEDLRQIMVDAGDSAKQVFILEFGWDSDTRPDSPYFWHAVTEQQKADYLVRAFKWAKEHWQPWIGVMSVIYIANPDWTTNDEQYWWAITAPGYPDAKLRPAYTALKEMAK